MTGKRIWTSEEDMELRKAIARLGEGGWASYANVVPGRSGKQCRDRWYNHLKPTPAATDWTDEDDDRLFEAQKLLGNSWSRIAQEYFPERTDLSIKNHFYSAMRKRRRSPTNGPISKALKKRKLSNRSTMTSTSNPKSLPTKVEKIGVSELAIITNVEEPCASTPIKDIKNADALMDAINKLKLQIEMNSLARLAYLQRSMCGSWHNIPQILPGNINYPFNRDSAFTPFPFGNQRISPQLMVYPTDLNLKLKLLAELCYTQPFL